MTKKKKVSKIFNNILWMVFDKVFLLALNLLVTVQIANYFGASVFGKYQYAVSVVAILEIIINFVDGRIIKKKYLGYRAETVVYCATVCRGLFSLLSFMIGIIFICANSLDWEIKYMLIFLLLSTIINGLKFGMMNRFEFLLKSKKIVIASDAASLIGGLLQLVAVNNGWGIVSITVISLFSTCINFLILFIQYKYKYEYQVNLRQSIDCRLVKEMIRESIPLAVAASCATIYTRCDSLMIKAFLTTAEVGIYSISIKLISIVQIIIAPVRESVFPKFILLYDTDRVQYEHYYVKITSILTWFYIVIAIASVKLMPFFFQFLSDEYAEAYPVFKIQILGTFFMFNAALRAGHFTLTNNGNILMWSQIGSVICNIVLNFFGIHFIGMYGAAIATVITQFLSLFLSNLMFKNGREVFFWQLKGLNPLNILKK